MNVNSLAEPANLPAVRSGSAIALLRPAPVRRPLPWVVGMLGAAAGTAGAALLTADQGGDLGKWLLVTAGPAAVVALSRLADRSRYGA